MWTRSTLYTIIHKFTCIEDLSSDDELFESAFADEGCTSKGEDSLRDNSTPVSTSGTTSVMSPSHSEGESGQEMQTHMDNSSSENQDVQQNQGTADYPISLDRDQSG